MGSGLRLPATAPESAYVIEVRSTTHAADH